MHVVSSRLGLSSIGGRLRFSDKGLAFAQSSQIVAQSQAVVVGGGDIVARG